MAPIFAAAAAAAAGFIATSVDELLLLVASFARASSPNSDLTPSDVVLGNLLGFALVLAASALGLAGILLPPSYIKLIGLLPLLLGCRQLARRAIKWHRKRSAKRDSGGGGGGGGDAGEAAEGLLPEPPASTQAPSPSPAPPVPPPALLARCLRPRVAEMAAITLAGGAEEVSVYLPLLASESGSPANVATVLLVLVVLMAVWLALAAALVRSPPVARAIENFGEACEPWLMIVVGIYCLLGSVLIPVPW